MAKMQDRVDWEKAAATGRLSAAGAAGNGQQDGMKQASPASGWLMLAAIAPAVGLGLVLSLWMNKGPLVSVAGSVVTFVLSLLGCVFGGVVWLVSGSDAVFHHFGEMLPWGKPGVWRGLAGVVSISVVTWLVIGRAAYARVRSPEATRVLISLMLLASALMFLASAFTLMERQRDGWGIGLLFVSGVLFLACLLIGLADE